jgi:Ca-activated chloride channel family protein
LLGVLALAGPTWERLPQPVYQAPDYRVIALDLSPSMNATDLPPSRLAHARFEVLDLLPKLNQEILRTLASAGGGRYVTAGLDDRDIETLIPARPAGLAQRAQKL